MPSDKIGLFKHCIAIRAGATVHYRTFNVHFRREIVQNYFCKY